MDGGLKSNYENFLPNLYFLTYNKLVLYFDLLFDCLDLYTQKEYLDGDNACLNEKTNEKENVYKSISFWSFPEILIVDFKRFSYPI